MRAGRIAAARSACQASRGVVCRFLCPSRLRLVAKLTPSFTSSVACVCRNWCSVQATPTFRQYPTHRSWID